MESELEVLERRVKGHLALIKGDMGNANRIRFLKYEIENLEQTIAMAKFHKVVPQDFTIKIGDMIIK